MAKWGIFVAATPNGPKPVPALLSKHLAVHRSLMKSSRLWVMSHQPTGMALAYGRLRSEMLNVMLMVETDFGRDLSKLAKLKHGERPIRHTASTRRLANALAPWRRF